MSDSNVNVTDDKAPPANTTQAAAPVKWIILCAVLSAIVVTAVNVFMIEHFLFEPGPFMVLWVAPALVCSVLLAVVLTNLKTHQRRVSASLLAAVLTVPLSFILLYISIIGLILYGLASSP